MQQYKIQEGPSLALASAPALLCSTCHLLPLPVWLRYLGMLLLCVALQSAAHGQAWQGALALGDHNLGSVMVQGSALDAAGNSYLIGSTLDDVTLGPDTLRGVGYQDHFLAKLDANGQWLWAQHLPATPRAIALDAAGNIYLTGSFQGTAAFGSTTLTSATSYYPDAFVGKLTPTGTWRWARAIGGTEVDLGTALAVDATGNVYLAGDFRSATLTIGTATLTNASSSHSVPDIFLTKLDPAGNWQWAQQVGGPGADWVTGLALDVSGSVYMAGWFNGATCTFGSTILANAGGTAFTSDGFLTKLTAAGAHSWTTQIGGPGSEGSSAVALDASGNIYLTGSFTSSALLFGSTTLAASQRNGADVYVAKLTPTGAWDWAQQTTGSAGGGDSGGTQLVVTATGNAIVLGQFSATQLHVGQQVLLNAGRASASLTNDGFVAKLTPAGAWEWAQALGGTAAETPSGLHLAANGDVVLAGTFESSPATFGPITLHAVRSSAFVGRLQASGAWRWVSKQADRGVAAFAAVATDAVGNAYVAGNFQGTLLPGSAPLTTTGNQDILVGKVSPTGQWLWAAQAGGTGADRATALLVEAGGDGYVTGTFRGTARFGTTLLTSAGGTDIFVAKLSASGAWLWAARAGSAADDGGTAVALDANGHVYVTGWITDAAAFGNTVLTNPVSTTAQYPFAAKLSGEGSWQWAQALGAQGQGNSLAISPGGDAYITGRAARQLFVTKISPAGSVSWQQVAGGTPFEDQGTAIGVDARGDVYVAGGFRSTSIVLGSTTLLNSNMPSGYDYRGISELFIAKLTAAGTWLWAHKASGAASATALAVDSQGQVLLTGAFGNAATFGTISLSGNASGSVFVSRLTATGAWQWAQKVNGSSTPGGLAMGPAGRVYVAGLFDGVVPFGNVTLRGGGYFRSSFLAWITDSSSPLATTSTAATAAFSLYPTIVQGNRVQYTFMESGSSHTELHVYTLTGQLVTQQLNVSHNGAFSTAGWRPGWYVVRLTTASGQYIARFYRP
ncbi:SBBP repeat-containing protein [Hymenobacter sp. YC55]|uniref:SBBP repeat-containing protein n=1 Tax=Hymenobacter sp. YC55 TaxID=3034019 RepID=UPI0023F6E253|nr:SBBP repeat-containing protein [Hymenobacter sp. YC55]MDF7815919.1 SBBP repeat-containing protein [Hymenobacter sp. YC55]